MTKDIPPKLNEEDQEAWHAYARSVKPMHKGVKIPPRASSSDPNIEIPEPVTKAIASKPKVIKPPTGRDLKNVHISARLDLHGMTLEKAHERIIQFIANSSYVGHRCVLIITGKGLSQSNQWWQEEGILRLQVPRWLDEAPLRSKITSHTLARPEHGGIGALYVFLKKRRAI
jgi:DNA-nicking Smr family endonuclease